MLRRLLLLRPGRLLFRLGILLLLLLLLAHRRDRPRRCYPRGSILRRLHDARLGLPPGVGLRGEHLCALLAGDVGALLGERGGVRARVPQPLVPERADLDVRVVRRARVVDDAAPALRRGGGVEGGVGAAAGGEAELPEGVALEVIPCARVACQSSFAAAAAAAIVG